jgi:hypothetical protein
MREQTEIQVAARISELKKLAHRTTAVCRKMTELKRLARRTTEACETGIWRHLPIKYLRHSELGRLLPPPRRQER